MERIFVSSLSLRMPGLPDAPTPAAISEALFNETPIARPSFVAGDQKIIYGPDSIPADHPLHPNVRDSKSMSNDVVSSCLAVADLVAHSGLSADELRALPLYVAKGVCNAGAAKEIGEFIASYFEAESGHCVSERNARLFGTMYPLIVLKVLSNTLQSFLSQIYGPCGDATTFGNTSQSGFHALVEGAEKIRRGQSEAVLVGASQASDYLSTVTHLHAQKNLLEYHESHCVSFLLLRSEKNLRRTDAPALAEVCAWQDASGVPLDFEEAPAIPPYRELIKTRVAQASPKHLTIFSGGLSAGDYQCEQAVLAARKTRTASWYRSRGTLGAASVLANVAAAASCLTSDPSTEQVDCLDRDVYGRESWIQLRSVDRSSK